MTTKGKIFRLLTYLFELAFFIAGIVFVFLHNAAMALACLAMSEICSLHRNVQNLAIVCSLITEAGGEE